jgi:hypothetical protein
MVNDDPLKRPTMDIAVARLESIVQGLSSWKLRSRVAHRKDLWMRGMVREAVHWYRCAGFAVRRVPAMPVP